MQYEQLASVVQHLMHWKHGKLIYPISTKSIYRVCATGKVQPHLVTKFNIHFDFIQLKLYDVLGWFQGATRFEDHFEKQSFPARDLIQVFLFLLREDLI